MTQREVVETMIRKHEISNFMYSDEDEDTSRYIMQNLDDRRTCRRSQYNKNENGDDSSNVKEQFSPKDIHKRILLGAKSNSIGLKTASIEFEHLNTDQSHEEEQKQDMPLENLIQKLVSDMSQNLEYLESSSSNKQNVSSKSTSPDEKKFFLYLNMLDQLSQKFPKLKTLLSLLKEGFQTTVRNIISNELKQKRIQSNSKIQAERNKERDNYTKIQKQYNERLVIIEEQEDIIETRDETINKMKAKMADLKNENQKLQDLIEKHRNTGILLQEENEQLRNEIERVRKIEEDILER